MTRDVNPIVDSCRYFCWISYFRLIGGAALISRQVGLASFCRSSSCFAMDVLLSLEVDASISIAERCGLMGGAGRGIEYARLSRVGCRVRKMVSSVCLVSGRRSSSVAGN